MPVKFYLKNKQKHITSIDAIIHYKGVRFVIATGESVNPKYWNNGRCRETKEYREGVNINLRLDAWKTKIEDALNHFAKDFIIPTRQQLIEAIQTNSSSRRSGTTFTQYMERQIEIYKNTRSKNTIKKYNTTLKKLKEYEKYTGRGLFFQDIDIHFFRQLTYWINKQGYATNSFWVIQKNISKFMNDAGREGLHTSTGHKHPEFRVVPEDSDTVYLDESELKRIRELKITPEKIKELYPDIQDHNMDRKINSLQHVRNRFLIGAYTLLRVSDYKRLSEVNIQGGFIRIKPKKRGKGRMNRDVIVPLHAVVKDILLSGFDINKTISEQKINKHIKEICKLANIKSRVSITRTEGGKEIERNYQKWQLVTSHTARRSAATNMILAGMNEDDVMMLGGWSSRKAFWKYLRMEPEINAKRLKDHPYFNTYE